MLIKKVMAGVFAIAILSGAVGNVGTVKIQAATWLGTIGQADFNKTCNRLGTWGVQGWSYNFKTHRCQFNGPSWLPPYSTFEINWNEVCRDRYSGGGMPWQRPYAIWFNCYRN